jgi:hypothetical protein
MLDPRMKHLSPFVPVNEHDVIHKKIMERMVDYCNIHYKIPTDNNENPCNHNTVQECNDKDDDDDLLGVLHRSQVEANNAGGILYNDADQRENQINGICKAELDRYKAERVLSMDKDPLEWWEKRKLQYPILYVLHLRYLSIPATSAPSERLWSLAARVVTNSRARMKCDLVAAIIFLKENSNILRKHYAEVTGETRIIPGVYGCCDDFDDLTTDLEVAFIDPDNPNRPLLRPV